MRKIRLWKLAAALVGLGVLGGLVVVTGVVPISARAGHWAITRVFLDWAKKRSVVGRSLPLSVG